MIDGLLRVDVLLFLAVGLLGGAHCIGMCGPLVTTYAARMDGGRRGDDGGTGGAGSRGSGAAHGAGSGAGSKDSGAAHGADSGAGRNAGRRSSPGSGHLSVYEVRQHAIFNLGRATSYATIGALLGGLGSLVFLSIEQVSTVATTVRGVVGIVVGAVVIGIGLRYVLGSAAAGVSLPGLHRVTGRLVGLVDRLVDGPGIFLLGALHGLLPCPILYPAYLFAFATGSVVSGAVSLFALGVGTIPAVFIYGTLIESVDAAHRRRVHRLLGVAFVVLGYVLLAHGLMAADIVHLPHPKLPHWDPQLGPASGQ